MHKFDDPQEFPWSSSEFEATELETDMEDCKTQLSDILFSPAAGSSTSALSSGSSYPATTLSQSSTGTQALLSRFPELTELDLQKVVDISSKVSYICCKCHDSHQPPPARHKTTSMYGKERRPKRFRISKPTYRSARLRSHVDVSNSGQKLSFQQDSEKDTDGIVELTMTSSHNIPDFRQRVPSIITYAPRGLYSLKADPQPPFVGIGPPGSRTVTSLCNSWNATSPQFFVPSGHLQNPRVVMTVAARVQRFSNTTRRWAVPSCWGIRMRMIMWRLSSPWQNPDFDSHGIQR
jgi:hypothetical protein